MAKPIPPYLVDYFLLGRTRAEPLIRFTQDGGIVSDVWHEFARDMDRSASVLIAPTDGTRTSDLGYLLSRALVHYRRTSGEASLAPSDEQPSVATLENYLSVTLYFDELIRIVLPLTRWWEQTYLHLLPGPMQGEPNVLQDLLEAAIKIRLGQGEDKEIRSYFNTRNMQSDWRVVGAASVAALIGAFQALRKGDIEDPPADPSDLERLASWIQRSAEKVASAATRELARPVGPPPRLGQLRPSNMMIQRVFLDRKARMANFEALQTVKADAAISLFNVSCRAITWGIIDSGIDALHSAFVDHAARAAPNADAFGGGDASPPTRVRAIYDFTKIDKIRSFDLTIEPRGSPERHEMLLRLVDELETMPGRKSEPAFRETALRNLEMIADQLDAQLQPDWKLIEPLIQLRPDEGDELVSDHATHVAGILGADWRRDDGTSVLRGVCPDINIYDLRVIASDRRSSEFAVIAALEFVQHLNSKAGSSNQVVHGVNISLSIPHDVRTHACGTTPVCKACNRLAASGVVVVTVAGNQGWQEGESIFGNFKFCSITDPGNAEHVITVGATHPIQPHTFGVSYFSGRGPTGDGRLKPDLVAPGENVLGPIRGGADLRLDGTSMAAPFVSGAAAILLARNRELIGDPARIKAVLCQSATDLGREKYFQGHGLVDVLRALQSV